MTKTYNDPALGKETARLHGRPLEQHRARFHGGIREVDINRLSVDTRDIS